ncbi:hypothetical protein CORC01_12169 [Colletotrichum orchidophilum]|uniref:Uncharacterized protein n=1 Tax=Colletotrichum orchidophilum TaxID=1209926 RepID=A0A1G4ATM4_9PEZI|nr:uncharacterized protein CORC01_12169 [Colletotrichum orchidophilum]OHE92520.1 hypothetical protein CORC01_12169 [Colletotrichum orchidophilum]
MLNNSKSQGDTAKPDTATNEPQSPFPSPSNPRKALQNPSIARYFSHYIADIAPWYDLGDASLAFATSLPEAALESPLPFAAIVALSAVHTSRTTAPSAKAVAEFYHGHCVRLLIDLTAGKNDDEHSKGLALASVCLLRSYEILSEEVDPNRHLQGAYSLAAYNTPQTDDFGSGLRAAGFWNYLREDITFSLFRRCPLKINLAQVPVALPTTGQGTDQDRLNVATLILGRIINACFVASESVTGDSWSCLLQMLREWRGTIPTRFEPFSTLDRGLGLALPSIWLLRDYHDDRLGDKDTKDDILELLALKVCGVAFTANLPSVQVNAFGPIAFCSRFIRTEASRQELIRRLWACKGTIGWPVQRLVSDLEAEWRGPPPTRAPTEDDE